MRAARALRGETRSRRAGASAMVTGASPSSQRRIFSASCVRADGARAPIKTTLTVRPPADTLAADTTHRAGSSKRPATATTAGSGRPGADSSGAKKEVEGLFIVDTLTMTARFHPVRVGIAGDEYFEVLGGVREGQTIVAGPYQAIRDLRNDAKVRNQPNGGGRGTQARPRS